MKQCEGTHKFVHALTIEQGDKYIVYFICEKCGKLTKKSIKK